MITPTILSTSIGLGAGDDIQLLPADGLKSVSKTPMWVDEIRFTITGVGPTSQFQGRDLMSLIDVELTFEGEKVNPVPTPVMAMCAPRDRLATIRDVITGAGDAIRVNRHTWRLLKPLFMAPGQSFGGKVVKYGPAGSTSQSAGANPDLTNARLRVDVVGRALPTGTPAPRELHLPFASGWRSPLQATATNVTALVEVDDDVLANPFQTALQIDYLGARAFIDVTDVGGDTIEATLTAFRPPSLALALGVGLRLSDSFGNGIIRDSTPLAIAIPWTKRAWRINTTMPPRSFFIGYLDWNTPILITGSTPENTARSQVHLAIVGHRKIAL